MVLGLDASARWERMAIKTLTLGYNDALAPVTLEAHVCYGRLLLRQLKLLA